MTTIITKKIYMQIISDKASEKIGGNNQALGALTMFFDMHPQSIIRMVNSRDIRLTVPGALEIIKEKTGLTEEEILEEKELESQN